MTRALPFAISGLISGSGFAIAKTIGSSAIESKCSSVSTPGAESPRKRSAPTTASERSPVSPSELVFSAYQRLVALRSSRPSWTMPFESQPMMFLAPAESKIFVQATPDAPIPLTTTFRSSISLPMIFSEFISAARATTAVPCWSSWNTGISSSFLRRSSISRRRDVLQVDPAEPRRHALNHLHYLVSVLGVQTYGEGVHTCELLEEHNLALHHRHRRLGSYVSQTQHRGTVRDHRHGVSLDSKVEGALGLLRYGAAHPRNPRRVGHREVVARPHRRLRPHLYLASKVEEERPVGEVGHPYLRECVDRVGYLASVLGIAGIHSEVSSAPLPTGPDDVNRPDHTPHLAHSRQDLAERTRLVRKLNP